MGRPWCKSSSLCIFQHHESPIRSHCLGSWHRIGRQIRRGCLCSIGTALRWRRADLFPLLLGWLVGDVPVCMPLSGLLFWSVLLYSGLGRDHILCMLLLWSRPVSSCLPLKIGWYTVTYCRMMTVITAYKPCYKNKKTSWRRDLLLQTSKTILENWNYFLNYAISWKEEFHANGKTISWPWKYIRYSKRKLWNSLNFWEELIAIIAHIIRVIFNKIKKLIA